MELPEVTTYQPTKPTTLWQSINQPPKGIKEEKSRRESYGDEAEIARGKKGAVESEHAYFI
jgi:hypothetical protein